MAVQAPPEPGALVEQELRGFLGVNLRRDRLSLADSDLAKAINADLHLAPGVIATRPGRTRQFATPLADKAVRRLAKINGKRYRIAGRTAYREQTSIVTALAGNLLTTIVPFQPLNDSTLWAFIADGAAMRKDDGTVTRTWGIAAPTAKPTVAEGGGPGLTGNYSVRYTYARKTADGKLAHESNPSPVSEPMAYGGGALIVSDIIAPPDAQVTHIRIYRTAAGGVLHLFEAEAAVTGEAVGHVAAWETTWVGTLTTYKFTIDATAYRTCFAWEREQVDGGIVQTPGPLVVTSRATGAWALPLVLADLGLGTAVELDNDPPPLASWAVSWDGYMVLCQDAANPHFLWVSKRFRPESFPPLQYIEIGSPDDPLQCAVPLAGLLAVFTRRTKYRVVGNTVSGFLAQEALSPRGTPSPLAVAATERGIVFLARDGVWATNTIGPDEPLADDIYPLFLGESVNGMRPLDWTLATQFCGAAYRERFYLAYTEAGTPGAPRVAVWSWTTKKWSFYDQPLRSLLAEEDANLLSGGGADGLAYTLEDGATDDGAPITLDVELADRSGGAGFVRKLYRYFRVDADAGAGSITAEFYVDGILKRSTTITGGRSRPLLPLPEGCLGYAWRVRLRSTGTVRARIFAVAALWLPLVPS